MRGRGRVGFSPRGRGRGALTRGGISKAELNLSSDSDEMQAIHTELIQSDNVNILGDNVSDEEESYSYYYSDGEDWKKMTKPGTKLVRTPKPPAPPTPPANGQTRKRPIQKPKNRPLQKPKPQTQEIPNSIESKKEEESYSSYSNEVGIQNESSSGSAGINNNETNKNANDTNANNNSTARFNDANTNNDDDANNYNTARFRNDANTNNNSDANNNNAAHFNDNQNNITSNNFNNNNNDATTYNNNASTITNNDAKNDSNCNNANAQEISTKSLPPPVTDPSQEVEQVFQISYEKSVALWKRPVQMTKNDVLVYRCQSFHDKQYGKIHVICNKKNLISLGSPTCQGMIVRHHIGSRFTIYEKKEGSNHFSQIAGISFIKLDGKDARIRFFNVAIADSNIDYDPPTKDGDLSRIAERGSSVQNVKIWSSVKPRYKGKGKYSLNMGPYQIQRSVKNFVVRDDDGETILFLIFKSLDGVCKIHTRPPFTPLIAFGLSVSILTSFK